MLNFIHNFSPTYFGRNFGNFHIDIIIELNKKI